MAAQRPQLLKKGDKVLDTYTVDFFLGQGAFGEVYRVRHKFLGTQVLKVFKADVSAQTDLLALAEEARILSTLTHPNIVRVFETNTVEINGNTHIFLTMGFVAGEALSQLLARKVCVPFQIAASIQMEILEGLVLAHSQTPPVVHRDISPDNIMLSYVDDRPVALLSDFGLAMQADLNEVFLRPAGKYLFMAPECFFKAYLPSSDVFSAGIVFYRMMTGTTPWELDISAQFGTSQDLITGVHKARKSPPNRPSLYCEACPKAVEEVVMKALALDLEDRYRDARQFRDALAEALKFPSTRSVPEGIDSTKGSPSSSTTEPPSGVEEDLSMERRYKVRRPGKGFDEIAGMHDLKEMLFHDVILPLQDKELYAQYQVSIPNGLLLFGPPGCGKTFIAQKFAKEVGYHYIELKPSDIASIYVHGTQEKIREVFQKAEENAPTLLFIDEIDAVMPSRNTGLSHSYASEVNEFLVQMTECHKKGIFIIAATNRPEMIDPAIMRTGRLDKVLYLGPPDLDARRELLIHLIQARPVEAGLELTNIASLTENFVTSDISFLVNEAAREALRERVKMNFTHFEKSLTKIRPSVSPAQIAAYLKFSDSRNFS